MIQAVLLIALGFFTASLIGVLVAPALWHRASRLSRKRLEHTLPITLSEIEASQDQLRASYAVRMRRLETALASAKQKAAAQLVGNSRLQMQILALKDQITDLDLKLSERRNAATVLEQTLTKRVPELDREISEVKARLEERSYAIKELSNKLERRNAELEEAQRAAASYEEEVARLREALEKNAADRGGRRLRGASKWSLDDYRAEYDRLNLELSKLRQQVAQLQDRDAGQSSLIKGELHKLTELILASAQPKGAAEVEHLPAVTRSKGAEIRRGRPVRWTETAPKSPNAAASLTRFDSGQQAAKETAEAEAPHGAASPAASDASAAKDKTQDAAHVAGDPGDSSRARSKLLMEAVPEKTSEHAGGGVSLVKEKAASAGAAAPPSDAKPAQEAAVNGSGTGRDSDASASDEFARQTAALMEKLRETGGEAV